MRRSALVTLWPVAALLAMHVNRAAGPLEKFGDERFQQDAKVSHVRFSPDSKDVATLGSGSLRRWKIVDGFPLSDAFGLKYQKLESLSTAVLSANNRTLVAVLPTAEPGAVLAAYDLRTGKSPGKINLVDNVGLEGLRGSHNAKWTEGFTGKSVVEYRICLG